MSAVTTSTDVIGRSEELAALRELAAAVVRGQGGAAWVDGEPGIGSLGWSRRHCLMWTDSRLSVLRAEGDELTPTLDLRYLNAALAGQADIEAIDDLFAGRGGGLDIVLAATDRIVGLVERECARSPVILVADDVQWADDASLDAIRHLLRVTGQAPLLLVLAGRRIPAREAVGPAPGRRDPPERGGHSTCAAGRGRGRPPGRGPVRRHPRPPPAGDPGGRGGNPLYATEILDACASSG